MNSEKNIVCEVSRITTWWVNQRIEKLRKELSASMSVNPFILPFLFDYHNIDDFEELQDLTISGHLMIGHNTGFGKLIDEKILPQVFNTEKLDKKYRKKNPPFMQSCFDEIDHIIKREDAKIEYLSLKAGKWTIQLTMAVQLNAAFNEIISRYGSNFDDIVVGVFYGRKEHLTDKYDILRGENRGASHDVVDLTDRVFVRSGKDFWAWLNDGEASTQEWVLRGIIESLEKNDIRDECSTLLGTYKKSIVKQYEDFIEEDGTIRWVDILRKING